jgi:hypothetical protein
MLPSTSIQFRELLGTPLLGSKGTPLHIPLQRGLALNAANNFAHRIDGWRKRFNAIFSTSSRFNLTSSNFSQVDCPQDAAEYIHRVGRTARYTSAGRSLLFLLPSEQAMVQQLRDAKVKSRAFRQFHQPCLAFCLVILWVSWRIRPVVEMFGQSSSRPRLFHNLRDRLKSFDE